MAVKRNYKIQNIRINNLEDIFIGKLINEETIISNKDNKISTVVEIKCDDGRIIRRRNFYLITDNLLLARGGWGMGEHEYNNYLNSIKQDTN